MGASTLLPICERPTCAQLAACCLFRARYGLLEIPGPIQDVAVGRDFALGDGRAQAPRRVDEYVAIGRPAQRTAGAAGGDQRLDENGHGGIGGIEIVRRHVAQRARGPQRGPARSHGDEEFVFIF